MRHRSPVAGHLGAGWAAAYAGLRAYWSMGGEWLAARCTPVEAATAAAQCAGRPLPQLDGLAGWGSVLALAVLAVLVLATVRPFGRRLPRTALLAAIWAGTLALLCFGGQILLLNLLRVLLWITGLPGRAAEPYWTLVVDQLIVLAGVGALAVAAWSFQRRARPQLTDTRAADRWLRVYGWTAALAPIQGWARRVPRPLVLAAGWTGGVGLLSMGLPAAVTTLGALAGLTEFPSAPGSANPWVFGVTYGGFLVWGAALVGLITCHQALSRRPARLRPAARKESVR